MKFTKKEKKYIKSSNSTICNNYLTEAIVKYFTNAKKYDKVIGFFKKIYNINPEIGSVIAKLYFESNRGSEGIEMLYKTVQGGVQSYEIYIKQPNFLKEKKRFNESYPWELLTNIYIDLSEYEKALQTLNSSPMFNNKKKDSSSKNFNSLLEKRILHNDNIPRINHSELHALNILYSIEESDDNIDDKFKEVNLIILL
ncbi:hypothetical protein BCR32DRAFT_273980 [Anaeromyces robustus]|uniref:Uncharacterized protein n=1 Tax=Anaeromyces robustus TaxID=1754192 RepID=A0A1Y1XQE4_9FUNG|nr:hypothetical protein BCR32DRAFT_273980 [Anaeromyces robustus]|eukprot:ORX87968.1 hypothetical protein BCR32DRAFT_273980 [Anaeromyces robustus]